MLWYDRIEMGQRLLGPSSRYKIMIFSIRVRRPSFRSLLLAGLVLTVNQLDAQTQVDCSSSIFSGTQPCQGQQQATQDQQQNISPQQQIQGAGASSTRGQQPNDTMQVYIDSAGNRWQRGTSVTDREQQQPQRQFPPDPQTDLQKLAHSSTGESLPIFGRNMFQQSPSTFAPADEVPVTPDYVLGPGDDVLVRISGAQQISSNSQLTVDTSGNIYVPRVGAIQVSGLRASELQAKIAGEVNHFFRNYQLSVSLGHLRSIQIYVVGEARRPGAYTISGLSTALNGLFASGGPNVQGSLRRIQLRRGDKVITELDLYDLILRGDKSHDIRLESGDILFIPAAGPQVAIAGSVRHPAVYELKADAMGQTATSLQDVLTLAGGFGPTADPKRIRLERVDADLQRHAMTVALDDAGKAMLLHDGDVVYANHIAPAFQKTITIRGNLANPGRFPWHDGMRLSDIIPDREALLTGDYWRERNRMGVPTPLFEPDEFNAPTPEQGVRVDSAQMRAGVVRRPDGTNSSRDALTQVLPPSPEGEGSQEQATLASGGVVSSSATQLDRSATMEAGTPQRSNSQPTYSQTDQANQLDQAAGFSRRLDRQQPVTAVLRPNIIRLPAPEINWSYAVIERLDPNTLKTTLVPFNLGKLVQDHDAGQNLELQPGDVVTILNQRDILVPQHEQTKFVQLEGEFPGAGVYSVKPGETLEQLVERAGGFTSSAYLYGSSFQRESTRALQQQRLDEYITKLSADMDRQTAVRGASTQTGVSDPNALALERNLVAQLRELRATGRIVLEFLPDSEGVLSLPHISLENGDVFRVPSRPSTVSVIGAVYGQNVFLYNPKRHLEDYLSLAGRPNRIADTHHAFIVRADGSVFSRERASGVLSNHFDTSRIFPGDAIIIPEKPISPTVEKQLLDYSQILSSFGLAAAALSVIRSQ